MAKTIVLEIDVKSGELDELNRDLEKTQSNLKETEDSSKKASKGLKDVGDNGGAIAVLDSLTGGLATRVRDAAEASKLFNFSLKGMRTALIATGIGAFVVALGLVVAYWDEIKQFVTGVNAELNKTIALQQELVKEQEHTLGLLDSSDEILKRQGKSQKEINNLKLDEIEALIKIQAQELENEKLRLESLDRLKKEGGSSLEQFTRLTQSILISFTDTVDQLFKKIGIDLGLGEKTAGLSNSIIENIFGTQEDLDASAARVAELELKLKGLQNRAAGLRNQNDDIDAGAPRGAIQGIASEEQLAALQEGVDKQLAIDKALADGRIINEQYAQDLMTKAAQDAANARAEITRIENQQKLQVTAQTLGAVAQLFGETSAAGKAAGSAQALINAYLGVTSVLANPTTIPEPFGTISKIASAGVILANGLKAVQQINSVKVPSGGGGSVSTGGIGGGLISPSSPSFNVVGNTGINQIGQAIGENNDQPTRAYVVFGDVKKAGDIERESVQEASL